MSNIKKLLEGVEVEWKTLGEIAENVSSGGTPNTGVEAFYGGNIPWLRTQEVGNGDIWSTSIKITELGLKNSSAKIIPANCIIVAMYGATVGKVGVNKIPLCTNQACANVQINAKIANYRYVYHFLLSQYKYIKSLGAGSQTNINLKIVKSLLIPIPCPNNLKKSLEIQQEIVRILDSFSMLTAELQTKLQAELQARKEQYEYYRNKLLMFDKIGGDTQSVTWLKMSEIGTFIRGKRFVRTDIVSNGVPCIHYGDMYTYYGLYATQSKGRLRSELASKMRYAQKNDVVIVAAGENKEDIGVGLAWLGDEPAAVHDACFIFRSDLYPQYVSHYLRSNYYHKQIVKYVSEGKICSISAKGLGNAIIPIPAHEEQVRIATLLNNFDALVGDLTKGIPAEMVAVQEQYEYYRNKLLSFPRIQISA